MKSFFIVFLLLSFASAEAPKYGWRQAGSETFALNAAEFRYFTIPHQGKWRFAFKADEAIYTGVASAEQFGYYSGKYLTHADFNRFSCVQRSIIEVDIVCNVAQPNERLAIRDKRGRITKLAEARSAIYKG